MEILRLEVIGDNGDHLFRMYKGPMEMISPGLSKMFDPKIPRPWVARIKSYSFASFDREFMEFKTDYSHANSQGSRGVYRVYFLYPGVYEVFARESWKKSRRYFILVDNRGISEITEDEVYQWLNDHSE